MSEVEVKKADRWEVPPYTGWRPRSMRLGRGSSEHGGMQRDAKRGRMGNRFDRAFYKSVKAHKRHLSRWIELCAKADRLNGISRKPAVAAE